MLLLQSRDECSQDHENWRIGPVDPVERPVRTPPAARHTPRITERRRGLRIRQNRPVKVLDTTTGKFFGGKTSDVSATGLRIELPAHATVRVGEMLGVHVGLNRAGETLVHRRQMMAVRVIWVRRVLGKKTLTTGVEFAATIGVRRDAA